jgi:hypothetical protein
MFDVVITITTCSFSMQVLAFAVLMTLLLMVPPMIWPKISKINLVTTASLADPE